MGEHVSLDTFRVVDITIQRKGGTFAAFVRVVEAFLAPLRAFFVATKHDYSRFNYLGEWHSHHSFALVPSGPDVEAMREIVENPQVGARFALLLLVRLDESSRLQVGVTVHQPGIAPIDATEVMVEA